MNFVHKGLTLEYLTVSWMQAMLTFYYSHYIYADSQMLSVVAAHQVNSCQFDCPDSISKCCNWHVSLFQTPGMVSVLPGVMSAVSCWKC